MITNVIFDLDGTLLNTKAGIFESIDHAAEVLGYPKLPVQTLARFLGPPLPDSFVNYYGCSREEAARAAGVFREYYQSGAMLHAELYPGILDLCQKLKTNGIRMAAATYKREDYALTLLRHFGFDRYFTAMHGADSENKLKKEEIVRLCMDKMGASADNSVLVGDTLYDALGAQRAGIPFLAVTYGFGFRTAEDAAEYPNIGTADSPAAVADILL